MGDIVLQTRNLAKRFGTLTAVEDLSLEIRAGEIFGFLGPNGAGKTTSINMMCGLLKPDSGQVFIQGKPVHGGSMEVRARVGMCPQEAILWEKLSCLEQLEFMGEMYGVPRRIARKRGMYLLETLGLAAKRYQTAAVLSGGMRRRLNLALALVHDPEIVVLDEAEAGLDLQSRLLVREYIRSLAHKKTVVLTTHNMDEADRLVDRTAIIDHGRLLVVDTPEALKRTIGEGDMLEIRVNPLEIQAALQIVSQLAPEAQVVDQSLMVHGRMTIELLPEIMQALGGRGVEIQDMHLRTNTLEDVFIALTGRRLR